MHQNVRENRTPVRDRSLPQSGPAQPLCTCLQVDGFEKGPHTQDPPGGMVGAMPLPRGSLPDSSRRQNTCGPPPWCPSPSGPNPEQDAGPRPPLSHPQGSLQPGSKSLRVLSRNPCETPLSRSAASGEVVKPGGRSRPISPHLPSGLLMQGGGGGHKWPGGGGDRC